MVRIKNYNPFLLPKRYGSPNSREEFSRKSIKEWIDDLPIGDIDRASFDLRAKLDSLNHLEIPPVHRFEILELLRPSIDFVLASLCTECADGVVPLSIRRRMAADLRQDVLVQAVKSYKTVLSQFHDATITGQLLRKHARSEALRNSLFYLGETILHSFITYQTCLESTWKELHGIYYYSIVNELQTTKDAGTTTKRSDHPGIEDLYKQILLLALANPNSMLCGEAEKVYEILKGWTPLVDLVPIKKDFAAESYFLIDAKSDGMPCAPNLCKKEKIAIGWYLVTDNLEKMLTEKVAKAEMSNTNMRPTDVGALRLMKRLKGAWSLQIRSREFRNSASGMVELICGLDTVHMAHGGARLSQSLLGEPLSEGVSLRPGYHTICPSILDNNEYLIEVEPGVLQADSKMAFGQKMSDLDIVVGKQCITANVSESGCCLNWPDSGDGGTHVGELVGVNPISNNGKESDLSLGVIRWMYAEHPGFLGMGVELLNGHVEPVILQRKQVGSERAENINGFLQHNGDGSSSNLIAPPFYVDKGDQYKVITDGEEIPVDLTNIVDGTDSFVRFEFEQLSVVG